MRSIYEKQVWRMVCKASRKLVIIWSQSRGNKHIIFFNHYETIICALVSRILQSYHISVRIIYYNQWLESYRYIRCDQNRLCWITIPWSFLRYISTTSTISWIIHTKPRSCAKRHMCKFYKWLRGWFQIWPRIWRWQWLNWFQ